MVTLSEERFKPSRTATVASGGGMLTGRLRHSAESPGLLVRRSAPELHPSPCGGAVAALCAVRAARLLAINQAGTENRESRLQTPRSFGEEERRAVSPVASSVEFTGERRHCEANSEVHSVDTITASES